MTLIPLAHASATALRILKGVPSSFFGGYGFFLEAI
jgi:hypothetical protein